MFNEVVHMGKSTEQIIKEEIENCSSYSWEIQQAINGITESTEEIKNDFKEYCEFGKKADKEMISDREFIFPKGKNTEDIRDKQFNTLLLYRQWLTKYDCLMNKYREYESKYNIKNKNFRGNKFFCGLWFEQPEFELTSDIEEFLKKEISQLYNDYPNIISSIKEGRHVENIGPYDVVIKIKEICLKKQINSYITCDDLTKKHEQALEKSGRERIKENLKAAKKSVPNIGLVFILLGFGLALIIYLIVFIPLIFGDVMDYSYYSRYDGVMSSYIALAFLIGLGLLLGFIGVGLTKSRSKKIRVIAERNPELYKASCNINDCEKEKAVIAIFESEQGKDLNEKIRNLLDAFEESNKKLKKYIDDSEDINLSSHMPNEVVVSPTLLDKIIEQFECGQAINYKEAYAQAKQIIRQEEKDEEERRYREHLEHLAEKNYIAQEQSRQRMEEMEQERLSAAREAARNSSETLAYQKQAAEEAEKIRKDNEKTNRKIRDEIDRPY